ncbi:MAG: hypothetical protein QXM20_01820 [Fervidicoccaceae archaeon]
MGRTIPSARMALEVEIERLKKMMEYAHDPEVKKAFEEILDGYIDLAPIFKAVPPYDKEYAVLLAGLIRALKRIDEIGGKLEPKG